MAKKCKYIKADGEQCGAYAVNGSDYCISHEPAMAGTKALAVKKGGRATQRTFPTLKRVRLKGASDIKRLMGTLINEVRSGEIYPQDASCIGYLAGIFLRSSELSDFEKRLTNIEKLIEARRVENGK